MKILKELSIITITYNNLNELKNTTISIYPIIKYSKHLIINGGKKIPRESLFVNSLIIDNNDKGIYDAINIGINMVKTKYFMLIHSGDIFISNIKMISRIINSMNKEKLDVYLNDATLSFLGFKRNYRSKHWYPWMLNFGVQPPHLPIIYRKKFCSDLQYNTNNKIIADFEYLSILFKKNPKFSKGNLFLIKMIPGGLTTNGIKSYFKVSLEFIKHYGIINGIFKSIFRIPIKFLLSR